MRVGLPIQHTPNLVQDEGSRNTKGPDASAAVMSDMVDLPVVARRLDPRSEADILDAAAIAVSINRSDEKLPAQSYSFNGPVKCRKVTGGLTNHLFEVRWDPAQNPSLDCCACLVRIFGSNTEELIAREKDNKLVQLLSQHGIGPRLFCVFDNGRVEEYINAKPIPPKCLGQRSPVDFLCLIAREVQRFHAMRDSEPDLPGHPCHPVLWDTLDKWMAAVAVLRTSNAMGPALAFLDVERLATELQWLKTVCPSQENRHGCNILLSFKASLLEQGLPLVDVKARLAGAAAAFEIVFAHNDILGGNILFNEPEKQEFETKERRLVMIDFEYADYNYCGYDLANHFCEYAGFDPKRARAFPSHQQQKDFLVEYFRAATAPHYNLANVWKRIYEQAEDVGAVAKRHEADGKKTLTASSARVVAPGSLQSGGGSTLESSPAAPSACMSESHVLDLFLDEMVRRINVFCLASDLFWGLWAVLRSQSMDPAGQAEGAQYPLPKTPSKAETARSITRTSSASSTVSLASTGSPSVQSSDTFDFLAYAQQRLVQAYPSRKREYFDEDGALR
jgi:thiamine kinase-like enzyme